MMDSNPRAKRDSSNKYLQSLGDEFSNNPLAPQPTQMQVRMPPGLGDKPNVQ